MYTIKIHHFIKAKNTKIEIGKINNVITSGLDVNKFYNMLVIQGQLRCHICNKKMNINEENKIYIANIIPNIKCPLYHFNDRIMHVECLEGHSQKEEILKRIDIINNLNTKDIIDYITGKELYLSDFLDPDNLINVGYLTNDESSPLYKYNGITLNKVKIQEWEGKDDFIKILKDVDNSDKWGGNHLKHLVNRIESNNIAPAFSDSTLQKYKDLVAEGKGQWWMIF